MDTHCVWVERKEKAKAAVDIPELDRIYSSPLNRNNLTENITPGHHDARMDQSRNKTTP